MSDGVPLRREDIERGTRSTPRGELDKADDASLALRTKQGDSAAFDALVRRYLRRAFSVAYRVLGHREDAEDITQESFAAALEHLDSYDVERPFGPWLFRIVVNRALNARRSRALRWTEPVPEDLPSGEGSPARDLERRDARERLGRALEALPERQRTIVGLFELEGFASTEIGEMLGLSDGTVRWHLHQARAALRAAFRTEEEES